MAGKFLPKNYDIGASSLTIVMILSWAITRYLIQKVHPEFPSSLIEGELMPLEATKMLHGLGAMVLLLISVAIGFVCFLISQQTKSFAACRPLTWAHFGVLLIVIAIFGWDLVRFL